MLIGAKGARQQLAQRAITGGVFAQQQQAMGLVAIVGISDPNIAAENRLDPQTTRGAVEFDRAEQIVKISQRQGRHVVCLGARQHLVQPHDTIDHGILAVQA